MARQDRIREELGWLKVAVVLSATATASVVSWLATGGATVLVILATLFAGIMGGLTGAIVNRVYALLAECEREKD